MLSLECKLYSIKLLNWVLGLKADYALWNTLSVQNIRNTFQSFWVAPSLSPSEQPRLVRPRTLQCVESFPQECWPMLTPMLPTVVSTCLDVLWVVDHSWYTRETVECEKPSRVVVLDTNRCAWHLLPYPVRRHLIFWVTHSPFEWHIHNPCLNFLKA
jgi:hypothetical protein